VSVFAVSLLFTAFYSCQSAQGKGSTDSCSGCDSGCRTGRKAIVPGDYAVGDPKKIRITNEDIIADFYSETFSTGTAMYVEICRTGSQAKKVSVTELYFGKRKIDLTEKTWGYKGLTGIDPECVQSRESVAIIYSLGGQKKQLNGMITLSRGKFPVNLVPLDLGKYSNVDFRLKPEILEYIQKCAEKKKKAFSKNSPSRIGNAFAHPRDAHYVTSHFWAKRAIMRYRVKNGKRIYLPKMIKVHRGLDLRGDFGEPVYAMADGIVAIAEPMYYEGNFIVIDHGNRIFSFYMHLEKFKVKEGDRVRAGDKIGLVGSTGLSTGAHLHVSLMIQDVSVDPLSILVLPVRD
jgi:hypothetical protein